MNRVNFRIYVDRGGKMPQMRCGEWKSDTHPYYVRYLNNVPVARRGPISVLGSDVTGTKIWDFSKNAFVPLESIKQE